MPSGVFQFRAFTSPPGADLTAAFCQASRLEALNSKDLDVMAHCFRDKNDVPGFWQFVAANPLTGAVIHNY
jgi:hypothetical protein